MARRRLEVTHAGRLEVEDRDGRFFAVRRME
jgi:hypothetical protein